jgi:hypothetical protein
MSSGTGKAKSQNSGMEVAPGLSPFLGHEGIVTSENWLDGASF